MPEELGRLIADIYAMEVRAHVSALNAELCADGDRTPPTPEQIREWDVAKRVFAQQRQFAREAALVGRVVAVEAVDEVLWLTYDDGRRVNISSTGGYDDLFEPEVEIVRA